MSSKYFVVVEETNATLVDRLQLKSGIHERRRVFNEQDGTVAIIVTPTEIPSDRAILWFCPYNGDYDDRNITPPSSKKELIGTL